MHDTDTFSFSASVAHHRDIGKTLFLSTGLHALVVVLAGLWGLPTVPWSTGKPTDPMVIVALDAEAGLRRPIAFNASPPTPKSDPLRGAETPAAPLSKQPNLPQEAPTTMPSQALHTLASKAVNPSTVDHASSTPPLKSGNAAAPASVATTASEASATAATAVVAPVASSPKINHASDTHNQLPISHASYLNNPPPTYPAQSRRLGEQGTAKWSVLIGTDGKASEATLVQSSGYSRLDDAAKTAVLSWRYVPGKRGGVALPMFVIVPVTFNVGQL